MPTPVLKHRCWERKKNTHTTNQEECLHSARLPSSKDITPGHKFIIFPQYSNPSWLPLGPGISHVNFQTQVLQRFFLILLHLLSLPPQLLIQPETVYERVQYQFEDDAYDTVPDLITFYVGSGECFFSFLGGLQHYQAFNLDGLGWFLAGKSISAASGARIQFPCNRLYPLSFYASKYGQHGGIGGIRGPSPLNSPSPVPSSPGFR